MKVIDIALKDLLRSSRSSLFWIFALVVPVLTAGLFYFAFGGLGSEDGFDLPITKLQVVNLDDTGDEYGGNSVGAVLVEVLSSPELADLVDVTKAVDPAAARAAVEDQEAGIALIIPDGFSEAAFETGASATLEFYQDPTLTLGPGIIKGIVGQLVDGFTGSKVASKVAQDQFEAHNLTLSQADTIDIAMQYGDWAFALGEELSSGTTNLVEIQDVGQDGKETDLRSSIVSQIVAGMMVFYSFFTGAASAQTILQEEEAGTLPRLFSTPTSQSTILGGKFLAAFVTLIIQVVVLVILSTLLFGTHWGDPLPVMLATLGLAVLATCFGIFFISLLRDTRQSGFMMGGVMTVLGMIGMMRTFVGGAPNSPKALDTVSLLTPQGWGVRAWGILLDGGKLIDILPTVGFVLVLGMLFFILGVLRFRRRFA